MKFRDWLVRQTKDQLLIRLFERFSHFALSVRSDQISYEEMRAVFRSIRRYGVPEIPVGGCKRVVEELGNYIAARGGHLLVNTQATELLYDDDTRRVSGVRMRDRATNQVDTVRSRAVVSNIGPRATGALLGDWPGVGRAVPRELTQAAGLKLHIVSDKSLILHNSIMFCLDTQRICGIVEVSRSVPSVVPQGQHMLDTFQVLMTDDVAKERELALADLRQVFGTEFDRHCRVVRASGFRRAWPVNHVIQGNDPDIRQPIPGLVMVGDGYKPAGHIMVEGVAASVRRVTPLLAGAAANPTI
jgi:phytoene dehydrogenase-like protein